MFLLHITNTLTHTLYTRPRNGKLIIHYINYYCDNNLTVPTQYYFLEIIKNSCVFTIGIYSIFSC